MRVLLDPAAAQQHHAVGHRHRLDLVVRDVHHRDAELCAAGADLARASPARSCASRFDSGSSIRQTGASAMIARPSATRCCWPPESCEGLRSSSARQAEQVGDALQPRVALGRSDPAHLAGRTRCSPRPKDAGTARSDWNTIAMLRCAGGSCVTSRPSIRMRPASACSRPAIRRKRRRLAAARRPEQHVERALARTRTTGRRPRAPGRRRSSSAC